MLYNRRGRILLPALFLTAALHAQSVAVAPSYANVSLGGTVQFTKSTNMLSPETVTWSVSGIAGGNSTVGTIDTTGLYHAPTTLPPNNSPLITARSVANTSLSASAYVYILPPGPMISAVNPNPLGTGSYTLTISGAGFLTGATILAAGVQLTTIVLNANTVTASYYQAAGATSPSFCVRNPGTDCSNSIVVPVGTTAGSSGPSLNILPATPSLKVGATLQFSASVTGLSSSDATWSVAGIAGGNATAGTISSTGLYTAPAAPPAQNPIQITAVSKVDGTTTGSTYAYILTAGPTITAVTPNPIPTGTVTITVTGSGFLSGATVYNGNVQLSTVGTPTANSITATGYQASAASTTICVRNPASVCSNSLVIPVTGSSTTTTPPPSTTTTPAPVVAPATATVPLGATQQFTASNVATWTASAGTIDASGLYTAPAPGTTISNPVTVTATGPGGSGKATLTLIPNTPPTITAVYPPSLPLGVFSFTVQGTGFLAQSVVQLNGKSLPATLNNGALSVTGFAGTSGSGTLTVLNGPLASAAYPVQIGVANPLVSAAGARRFLEQAAFGPTPQEADHVQSIGYDAWITEQFNLARVSNYNSVGSQGGMGTWFLANAVTNPDQLRQRVAFALSQIFVTSLNKLIWNSTMVPYQHMLMDDAFTNYRKILVDVTLSPAMGMYLDIANNAKANPAQGAVANENYAREVLQLFSIGTTLLNPDGTPAGGLVQPTYDQGTITEFARVFTGWTYAPLPGKPVQWNAFLNNATSPMVFVTAMHDAGAKTLFSGFPGTVSIAAGLSPDVELNQALDAIANHPNTAPFICKQLIQHLVKSNPTPAYVQRVVSKWGASGDMQAVVRAILLDPEARADDDGAAQTASDGHLQEPALFLPGIVRAFGGQMTGQNYYASEMAAQGEDLYNAPSVFNYFSPGYTIANTGGLKGPEFQLYNPNNAILRENLVANLFNQYSNPVQSYGPGTTIDLTPLLPLAATPATLVDAIDLTLTHGLMPAAMKQTIVNTVTGDASGNLHRVQTAIYLTLQSSYYSVWH